MRKNINTIIIEGCDGTGKSSLLTFDNFKDATILHTGPPSTFNPYQEYVDKLISHIARPYHMAAKMDQNAVVNPAKIIFDRFHIGEFIYQPIFRPNYAKFTMLQARLIARIMLGLGSTGIVFARPPFEVVLENFKKNFENELPQNCDQIFRIYHDYIVIIEDIKKHTGVPVQIYDYTIPESLDDTLEFIHGILGSKLQDSRELTNTDIRYLIVTETDITNLPAKYDFSNDIALEFLTRYDISEAQVSWFNLSEINNGLNITTIDKDRITSILRHYNTLILIENCNVKTKFLEFLEHNLIEGSDLEKICMRCHYVKDWEKIRHA